MQQLGDLDRVERGALEQVVAHHEEVEAVVVVEVRAHAPDGDLVAPGPLQRGGDVVELEVGEGAQHPHRLVEVDRALEGRAHLDGVAHHHRHAHARRRDVEAGDVEDLARLVAQLHLLVAVAALDLRAQPRHHVEGQCLGVDLRLDRRRRGGTAVDKVVLADAVDLGMELVHALLPGAAGGLEGGADHRRQPEGVVQRLGREHDRHRRAVRVRHDALADVVERIGVDLRHDQRDLGVHAPRRRVVDHEGARRGEARRPLARGRAAGAEQRHVEALDRLVGQRLDDHVADLLAGRARGGEGHDVVGGKAAALEQREQERAHGAGGAHDGDPHANSPNGCSGRIEPSPESSNALCSALTASGTRSPGTTHEIRIGEVEIIMMLIALSPSVVKTFAATPGWVFIPAPTIETFPIDSSVATVIPSSEAIGSRAVRAAWMSSRGMVKDMSARAYMRYQSLKRKPNCYYYCNVSRVVHILMTRSYI